MTAPDRDPCYTECDDFQRHECNMAGECLASDPEKVARKEAFNAANSRFKIMESVPDKNGIVLLAIKPDPAGEYPSRDDALDALRSGTYTCVSMPRCPYHRCVIHTGDKEQDPEHYCGLFGQTVNFSVMPVPEKMALKRIPLPQPPTGLELLHWIKHNCIVMQTPQGEPYFCLSCKEVDLRIKEAGGK